MEVVLKGGNILLVSFDNHRKISILTDISAAEISEFFKGQFPCIGRSHGGICDFGNQR